MSAAEPSGPVLDLREMTPPLAWADLFPAGVAPVELEIGTGKGLFLRRQAAARPQTGFLGVERSGKWFRICARRLACDGRPNVRIVQADAHELLARWIPLASLAAVHVLFPDPWPKKRHAKRRLLGPVLFDLVARGLAPGGMLGLATDVDWYFEEAVTSLKAHPCFDRLETVRTDGDAIETNYALKYAKRGRELRLARFARNVSPPPAIPPPPSRRRGSASTPPPPSLATAP